MYRFLRSELLCRALENAFRRRARLADISLILPSYDSPTEGHS